MTAYGLFGVLRGEQTGALILVGAVILVVGYFRYGAISPAFFAVQSGDIDAARRHLASIRFPQLLNSQSQAYYHWTKAVVDSQDGGDLTTAEAEMRLAVNGKFRTSNDQCLATATLAEIVGLRNDRSQAVQILGDAERIAHRPATTQFLETVRAKLMNHASS
ncbi:hypothetical protein [Schlesneria paludicola]|uniref:hypothetical protein n=1 Tax=Schlesneria paludicola TaxID=360056 RepID=UPI001ED9717D|nr:hypothetical protein [Schlesneria paludicola]